MSTTALLEEMSTLLKSGTLWFSDYHKRWITGQEALTCPGFPIDKELSYNVPCCSWAMRTSGASDAPFPGRSVTIGQAGNSMHTEVAATMISYCLSELVMEGHAREMFKMGFVRVAGNLHPPEPVDPDDEFEDFRTPQILKRTFEFHHGPKRMFLHQ